MLLGAALVAVAAAAGVAGAFLHGAAARLDGVLVPYGLIVALLGAAAVLAAAHMTLRSQPGKAAVAAGWLVPVVALSRTRPAGDLVIAGDAAGLVFALGGMVLAGLAVGLPVSGPTDAHDGGGLG